MEHGLAWEPKFIAAIPPSMGWNCQLRSTAATTSTLISPAQGENDIHLVFPVGAHECDAILSAYGGKLSGLYEFDGHGVEDSPINSKPGTIENNRRHRLSISVRLEKEDRATIKAFLDGKPAWPDWQGNPEHWSVGHSWAPLGLRRLAIGQLEGQVTFHSIRLKMVSGHAETDPPFTPEPGLPTIISALG